jgi:hypothetical protein
MGPVTLTAFPLIPLGTVDAPIIARRAGATGMGGRAACPPPPHMVRDRRLATSWLASPLATGSRHITAAADISTGAPLADCTTTAFEAKGSLAI